MADHQLYAANDTRLQNTNPNPLLALMVRFRLRADRLGRHLDHWLAELFILGVEQHQSLPMTQQADPPFHFQPGRRVFAR